jgi:hypothetical protein
MAPASATAYADVTYPGEAAPGNHAGERQAVGRGRRRPARMRADGRVHRRRPSFILPFFCPTVLWPGCSWKRKVLITCLELKRLRESSNLSLMIVGGIYTHPTDAYKAVTKTSLRDYSVWIKITTSLAYDLS